MAKNWTENQRKAIFANGGSVLVSAAAGSGKTAVLVQKIIELITSEENPVDVDRLLVVTFTRAAASEMRERVSQAVNALLENDPGNPNLLRQKQMISKANISTIDSFCIDLAREYFYKLNIKQDFRIADSNELKVLENEAMEDTLEYFYDNGEDDFKNLVKAFSSPRDDKPLINIISRVHTFLLSHPFPEKWLSQKLSMYNAHGDVSSTVWGEEIISYSLSAVEYCMKICETASVAIKSTSELINEKCNLLFHTYGDFLKKLAVLLKEKNWDSIRGFLNSYDNGRLTFPKKFQDDGLKNQIKNCRENIKKTVEDLQKLFVWNQQECKEDILTLKPLVSTLFECVTYYGERINKLKLDKNIADFSDIEHFMIRLFVKDYSEDKMPVLTDTAKEVSKRFDYIMVDECQDVNEVQDLIFLSISKEENNLFMVGDVKQSIYGFRQAMPEIFLSRKNAYPIFDGNKNSYPAKIILDKNFRSRRGIAEGINFIFSHLMSEEVGDMEYTQEEVLNPAATFEEKDDFEINLTLIDRDSYDSQIDFTLLEARYIALKIQKMVLSKYQITENGHQRDARYGDFAILLRSTAKTSDTYVSELMSLGVPAFSETKGSFFESDEIKIMINFLKVLDNPIQDIPLLSLMMSPIYGFTADDMAEIRCFERYGNLYSAVSAFADHGNEKARDFQKEISYFRSFSVTHSVEELIREIYEQTAYPAIVSAVEIRQNAVKNLNLLCEYAAQYESGGYKGLSAFTHYLDKIKECGCDFEAGSLVNGEITNTVKVMSIHSSKGLEFPVCFIAATSRKFNKKDLSNDVLLHSNMGVGIKKRDNLCRFTTMPREGVALNISKSQMSEELRVLYVALTRAKEKLFVVSSQKNPQSYLEKLSSKISIGGNIPPYAVKNAQSISDWIFMCGLINPENSQLSSIADMSNIYKAEYNGNNEWEIDIVDKTSCDLENCAGVFPAEIFAMEDIMSEAPPENFMKTLEERINFKYPFEPLVELPTKVSASDMAHRDHKGIFSKVLQKPAFLSQKELTAVQRGTAFHKFLQYCSFQNASVNPADEIQRLKNIEYLTCAEADSISVSEVEKFMNSSLSKRILQSKEVMREFRFISQISAKEFNENIESIFENEKILLQGAVDLAFEEDGSLVIVDYKTDRVTDILKLKEVYEKQLLLYKKAMEECTDYKVKECIIYSLYLSDYLSL